MERDDLYRICPRPDLLYAEVVGRERLVSDGPDLGDTRSELYHVLVRLIGPYSVLSGATTEMVRLALNAPRDDDSDERIRELIERRWRSVVTTVLERGTVRGDLPPDADIEAMVNIFAGAVTYHSLFGKGEAEWRHAVPMLLDMVLSGVVPLRNQRHFENPPINVSAAVERAFKWIGHVPTGTVLPTAEVPLMLMSQAPQNRAAIGDYPVTVSVRLHSDLMPGIRSNDPLFRDIDSRNRLSATVRVATDKKRILPSHLRADRILVVHGDEVWVAPLVEAPATRTSREFSAGVGLGPRWEPRSLVDVVVRLRAADGSSGLIRLIDQVIGTSS
ncbi:TetR family transcriptional regulator [Actinoplanes italicus]|uniref:TetR family transcriptional regulator n=2 Tax=Actinoplanes italicus TaxID=113567 RepID=A0A2T0K6S6_9ACTN|nr:TetR family transcriptional regulator [Actinoplanes italicus]